MTPWIRAYGPALFWAAALLFIGSRQDLPSPGVDVPIPIDKVAHFILYGVLGALAAWGWQRSDRRGSGFWPLLAVWVVGAIDERHQSTLPARSAEVADWVADALGASFAFFLLSRWARAARKMGAIR